MSADEIGGAAEVPAVPVKKPSEAVTAFLTEPKLEKDGVWVVYGDEEWLLARAGSHNRLYNQISEAVMRPYRRQAQLGTLHPDKADELVATIFARSVVRGWKKVTDLEGNLLEFNEKNVIARLLMIPDQFETIREDAMRPALYRREMTDVDKGNLRNT